MVMIIIIGSVGSPADRDIHPPGLPMQRPLKGFQEKMFQEPKRHSSEKIISSREEQQQYYPEITGENGPNFAPGLLNPAAQFYHTQMVQHRSGVSTPPPPGMQYYNMAPMYPPPAYGHYSTNTLPQNFVQNFQALQIDDPNQYAQAPQGYYPYYMGFPQMTAYPAQPPMMPQYYTPSQPAATSPSKKKKSPTKPSQFRPQPSSFASQDHDHGEHNAENEEFIVEMIREFEDGGSDTSALKGKVSGLALTQTGSRFLQKQLTKASPSFVTFVLEEVLTHQRYLDRSRKVCLT